MKGRDLENYGAFLDSYIPDNEADYLLESDHLTNEEIQTQLAWAASSHDNEYFGEGFSIQTY